MALVKLAPVLLQLIEEAGKQPNRYNGILRKRAFKRVKRIILEMEKDSENLNSHMPKLREAIAELSELCEANEIGSNILLRCNEV